MRRKEKEITDRAHIDSILKRAEIGHLGLADNDAPYVVPVNYGYSDGFVYIHSASEGMKIDTLKKNNRVCFQVEAGVTLIKGANPCRWGVEYESVIGVGSATFVDDLEEKKKALAAIFKQYSGHFHDFSEDEANKVTIIRLQFDSLTGKVSPPRS